MSYAQVAQHHKDNAQKEKQQRNEKQTNEQVVASSNGKYASSVAATNTASGRTANDSRDSRGKF